MTTARDIITKALLKVGANFKGKTVADDEANDALDALNALMSSLSNDSMMIYKRTSETFTLSAGVSSYTIGTGQTLNTEKPLHILEANIKDGNTEYPLVIIPDEMFAGYISDKTIQGLPQYINNDNGHAYSTLKLFPVPSKAYQLTLLSEKQLTTFTLDDVISLPAGWERMLIYNLAVELFPEYEQQIDTVVAKLAEDSSRLVRANIIRNRTMDVSPVIWRNSKYYTGGWR